jgi:antitoxin (DNA-binding transcriptional repressor) of toxin-antitoxin stability system
MSLSELRAALPSVLSRVEEGEEVTVTRHGKAIAVLVRPDVLRRGRNEHWFAKARELRQMLEGAHPAPLGPEAGRPESRTRRGAHRPDPCRPRLRPLRGR